MEKVEGLEMNTDGEIMTVRMESGIGHPVLERFEGMTLLKTIDTIRHAFIMRHCNTDPVAEAPRGKRRGRQVQHTQLWKFLDDLELHQTWFVAEGYFSPSSRIKMAYNYNLRGGHKMAQLTVTKPKHGILFVRIE